MNKKKDRHKKRQQLLQTDVRQKTWFIQEKSQLKMEYITSEEGRF